MSSLWAERSRRPYEPSRKLAQTAKEKETQIIKRRDGIGGRTINLLLATTGERVPFSHQERRNKTSVVSSRSGNRCSSPNALVVFL